MAEPALVKYFTDFCQLHSSDAFLVNTRADQKITIDNDIYAG